MAQSSNMSSIDLSGRGWCWRWQEETADRERDCEMEVEGDGKWRLPSGSGSLAMLSSRRHRLNVSVWQAWYDNAHLEETERNTLESWLPGTVTHTHIHIIKVEQKQCWGAADGHRFPLSAHQRHHAQAREQAGEMFDRRYLWDDESAAWVNIRRKEPWLLLREDK